MWIGHGDLLVQRLRLWDLPPFTASAPWPARAPGGKKTARSLRATADDELNAVSHAPSHAARNSHPSTPERRRRRHADVTLMADKIEVWTDGACSGNPGPGGWGALIRINWRRGGEVWREASTTNNRMELMAAIVALESQPHRLGDRPSHGLART